MYTKYPPKRGQLLYKGQKAGSRASMSTIQRFHYAYTQIDYVESNICSFLTQYPKPSVTQVLFCRDMLQANGTLLSLTPVGAGKGGEKWSQDETHWLDIFLAMMSQLTPGTETPFPSLFRASPNTPCDVLCTNTKQELPTVS